MATSTPLSLGILRREFSRLYAVSNNWNNAQAILRQVLVMGHKVRSLYRYYLVIFVLLFTVVNASAVSGQMKFFSCTDFHCDKGRMVSLTPNQWQSIQSIFNSGNSPVDERENIRQAIAMLEKIVGAMTGTWRDLAGNAAGDVRPGQLDCISESKNTSTYLQLMFDDGLLKWHKVEERQVRHPLIFNTHWTAVITDLSNGEQFAVDSWFRDNGEPPVIQPLGDWLKGRKMEE